MYTLYHQKMHVYILCSNVKINYLIDEEAVAGKGANTVISFLHHFFDHHSLGETILHLNADNCSGQNKNNAMVQVIVIFIYNTTRINVSSYLTYST